MKCKDCNREKPGGAKRCDVCYSREYRKKNPLKIRAYNLSRKEIQTSQTKEFVKKNPEKIKEYSRRDREKHHIQHRARRKANYNIKIPEGCMCVKCNERLAMERHHEDYSKPMEVLFLCRRCHSNIHSKLRMAKKALASKQPKAKEGQNGG